MLVEYLRELSPDSTQALVNENTPMARTKRNARQHHDYGDEADKKSGEDARAVDLDAMRKVEIGSRFVSVEPYRNERIRKATECDVSRRRIAQLDQYELDKTLTQSDEAELNIRKVVNYRWEIDNQFELKIAQTNKKVF